MRSLKVKTLRFLGSTGRRAEGTATASLSVHLSKGGSLSSAKATV
jgi:hypothetical protein